MKKMTKEEKPKHHRICMKCRVESTGKSAKECEKSFPRCGLNGGVPNDACKTTIFQDGTKVFELIKVVDLTKIKEKNKSLQEDIKKLKSSKKADNSTVPKPTPDSTNPEKTPKPDKNSKSQN